MSKGESKAASLGDVAVKMSEEEGIRICCITWNVGNAKPKSEELDHLLPKEKLKEYDIIVVGTQENHFSGEKVQGMEIYKVDTSAVTKEKLEKDASHQNKLVLENQKSSVADLKQITTIKNVWDQEIMTHLGKSWIILKKTHLGQMKLMVVVRDGGDNVYTGVESNWSACGVGGVGNNKGGLVISFHYRNTSFAFMSSHLAAHMEHYKRRVSDFSEILRETKKTGEKYLDVASCFDHFFWMGDLNFRVDLNKNTEKEGKKSKEENWEEVNRLVKAKKWSKILEFDQLKTGMATGEVFADFQEHVISFAPTFKVEKGKPGAGHYMKKRVPAYCDRVLWRSMPHVAGNVQCTMYNSCHFLSTSDHKPVVANFSVTPSTPPPSVYNYMTPGGNPITETRRMSTSTTDYFQSKLSGVWPVVTLEGLRAEGLQASDVNGKSDPYITFFSNPHGLLYHPDMKKNKSAAIGELKTAVISANLNPEWSESDIPMLRPMVSSQRELDCCSLIMLLRDKDMFTGDDILGTVIIRFPAGDKNKEEIYFDFDEDVFFEGKKGKYGSLKGRIKVSWSDSVKRRSTVAKEKVSSSAGCCLVS